LKEGLKPFPGLFLFTLNLSYVSVFLIELS
jgi:hypothetical protein